MVVHPGRIVEPQTGFNHIACELTRHFKEATADLDYLVELRTVCDQELVVQVAGQRFDYVSNLDDLGLIVDRMRLLANLEMVYVA